MQQLETQRRLGSRQAPQPFIASREGVRGDLVSARLSTALAEIMSGRHRVRESMDLLHERADSEWRDDPSDGDDPDWRALHATQAAANDEVS